MIGYNSIGFHDHHQTSPTGLLRSESIFPHSRVFIRPSEVGSAAVVVVTEVAAASAGVTNVVGFSLEVST